MAGFRLLTSARWRIEEIYAYSHDRWGEAQARKYVGGMFDEFDRIAARETLWRPIPAEFGVTGYFGRYGRHFIFWRELPDGAVGVVSVLDQRMDVGRRLREDADMGPSA